MEENNQHLVAELGRYRNMRQLRQSLPFRRHEAALKQLFNQPRTYLEESAKPRLTSFLRVVAWNIECGKRLDGVIDVLNTDPVLKFADLLLLTEVDDGMARSGNRSIASELGRAIGAHAIYGVEYLELSAAEPHDGNHSGNTAALHGNAILTRHAFTRPRLVRLPRCEKNYESRQKRLGGRLGLLVDLEPGSQRIVAATTHLDVVNAPRCRQKQLKPLLDHLAACGDDAAIVGGDLNTHTFVRGDRVQAFATFATMLVDPEAVFRRLSKPERFEPALVDLERFDFRLQGFNDDGHTCRVRDYQLMEAGKMPGLVRGLIKRRFRSQAVSLDFRLDWLAGRHLRPLGDGEIIDSGTGVSSISARTIAGLEHRGWPVSDHNPVVADIGIDVREK